MQYMMRYPSPLGEILLAADPMGLTGLWFEGQKYFGRGLDPEALEKETPVLRQAMRWLDIYFSGSEPDFFPPLHITGTDFQKRVWSVLRSVPYGHTITYGEIGKRIAEACGRTGMSPQAVGGAVGRNPVGIIIPCHRVVGADGCLTGYAGGVDKKIRLLELERVDMHRFFPPKEK